MKKLGQVVDDAAAGAGAAKRARHRKWFWCRRWNGFNDDPLFRVAAKIADMPLGQVQAFVNRLEELANKSEPRGYVGDFNTADFAVAQDITPEQAARIYAALEHPDVRWIDQEHVATFYARNKDEEDTGAALRQRRKYARDRIRKALAKLAAQGVVAPADRDAIEADLEDMPDDELFELERRRRIGQLAGAVLSTASRDAHDPHAREDVRLTARAQHIFSDRPVENSAGSACGTTAGPSDDGARGVDGDPQAQAVLWLDSEGTRIVVERMECLPGLAKTRIERWLQQELGGDAAALREIVEAAERADYMGARFHNLVVDGIRRAKQSKGQQELRLPPAPVARKVGHGG